MSTAVPDVGFVGRGRELDALTGALGGAERGIVLVSGPAGVGKTTLVDRAVAAAGPEPLARGYCPAEAAPPLWPWRAALRRAGVDAAPGPEAEPAAAASARFAALARMSDALLAAGPLAVVIEDLHWADVASLDLLAQVAAGAGGAPITVVGTVRTPAAEDVAVRLAALGRYGARTIALSPFSAAEVAAVVGPDDAADVLRRTGGLPLLVATARAGYAAADLATVVRSLLAALTPAQRAVVEAASVLGEDVDEELLAAVTGERADDVAAAVTAAWRGGLLTHDGRGYRFLHALVRDGIADRLDPTARRRLNRAAALALESAADADRAGRIAAHWERAGPDPADRRAASRWWRRAAVSARAAHAYDDAAGHLARALDGPTGVERVEVLLDLAEAEYLAGRYDRSLDHCAEAAEAAGGRGDLVARSALVIQGVIYPHAREVLGRLCRSALAYPDLPVGLRARVLAQYSLTESDAGRVGAATGPARESLALAEVSGDPHAEIEAARAREMTLVAPDDVEERLRLGDLVADRAEGIGQPLAAVIGHEWRVHAGYLLGRLDLVDAATAAIERLTERSGLPLARWHRYRLLAGRALLAGRFAESAARSRQAMAIAEASGDEIAANMYYAHGIQLALVRGDAAALPDGYLEAMAAAPAMPLIDVARANSAALTGATVEAREFYERVRAQLPVSVEHPAWAAMPMQAVDLIERFADAPAAEIAYRQLAPFRPYPGVLGTSTVYFTGTISRYLGVLAAVLGDTALAVELQREALDRNRALGARPDVATTSLHLARLLRGDRPAEAAELAQAALDIATRLDMPGTVAAAGPLVAEIAAERDRADPFTVREREIAALVARAMTNRQIAEKLVLSERTIESHVRSILAKAQCANRVEFVARWEGAGPRPS